MILIQFRISPLLLYSLPQYPRKLKSWVLKMVQSTQFSSQKLCSLSPHFQNPQWRALLPSSGLTCSHGHMCLFSYTQLTRWNAEQALGQCKGWRKLLVFAYTFNPSIQETIVCNFQAILCYIARFRRLMAM